MFTNSASRRDFFLNALVPVPDWTGDVLVAVAFLTTADPLLELARSGCRVKVIARLGFPTKPGELQRLLDAEGVELRYVNSSSFHPKLYIFADRIALVGSSNLTGSALHSNQEVNVAIEPDDDRFQSLMELFFEYWEQVLPLDDETLQQYSRLYRRYLRLKSQVDDLEGGLKKLPQSEIGNIQRGPRRKRSKEAVYLDSYRKSYQSFRTAFDVLRRIYSGMGERKYDPEALPLRLEIDSFLGWLREAHARGDSWREAPLRYGDDLERFVLKHSREWLSAEWRWVDEEVIPKRYPTISRVLGSQESIKSASYDEVLEALSTAHSFYDRLRFFKGGHQTHLKEFRAANELGRVKKTLSYLLHSKRSSFEVRLADCIYSPEYKLIEFGRSACQEVLGWVNTQEIPICNGRTLKSLRWLGFGVTVGAG